MVPDVKSGGTMRPYHSAASRSRSIRSSERLRVSQGASGDAVGTLWASGAGGGSPGGGTPAPLGLSLVHKPTLGEFKLSIACGGHGGALVQVGVKKPPLGCRRGIIRAFSPAAARRMHRYVDAIDRSRVRQAWFTTHTCWIPPERTEEQRTAAWEGFEDMRERYAERLRRRWGDGLGVIW